MWYVVAGACVLAGVVGVGLLVLPAWGVLAGFVASQLIAVVGASATGRGLARAVGACSSEAPTLTLGQGETASRGRMAA